MSQLSQLIRCVVLVLFFVTLTSCGGSKTAGRCPRAVNSPCLTGEVCTWDKAKGCEVCYCDSLDLKNQLPMTPGPEGKKY